MVPALCQTTAAVPPPADTRALAKQPPALHLNAVTVVQSLHLLTLCRLAVQLAQRRCPPPLPKGPGGAPRTYTEESLLLIALLRTLWRLSYQDMHDWLVAWPCAGRLAHPGRVAGSYYTPCARIVQTSGWLYGSHGRPLVSGKGFAKTNLSQATSC